MTDTYLVTGSMGCIGAWTLYHLVKEGKAAVSFDLSDTRHRLNMLLTEAEQEAITFLKGDITDFDAVRNVFESQGITHIIHLAALQIPLVRKDPVLGCRVNVVGTTNIFEAAHQVGIKHVAYASSIAVYGPPDEYPDGLMAHDAPKRPRTLYGVTKVANEGTADVYWREQGISSVTMRPYTVYGVGRDQGLTSEPTKALMAAAKGEDYEISFGGQMQFHFASDVARQFIAAADGPRDGAHGFNMGQAPTSVSEFARLVEKHRPGVSIRVVDKQLPFPIGFDATALHGAFDTIYETPLEDGVQQTLAHFERIL